MKNYYILEGELSFNVGGNELVATPGDYVFLPRGVKHEFKVLSDSFRCQVGLFPTGLEGYFMELSVPHNSLEGR